MSIYVTVRKLFVCVAAVAAFAAATMAQSSPASDLYQEALRFQESKGDLAKAIEIYRSLIDRYPQDAIVPRALLELAGCYEKTGHPDALATYERLTREFSTSPSAAAARARIGGAQARGAMAPRLVWDRSGGRISPDGKFLAFVNWATGNLSIRELPSGRIKALTASPEGSRDFAEGMAISPDGKSILYTWWNDKRVAFEIRLIGRDGGQPRVLFEIDEKATGYASPVGWTRDRRNVVLLSQHKTVDVVVVPLDGGAPRLVKSFEEMTAPMFRLSPTADVVAFDMESVKDKRERDVFLLSLKDGAVSPLVTHSANDRIQDWFPAGDRIMFSSDRGGSLGLWSVGVADGRAQGEATSVQTSTGLTDSIGFTAKGDYYYGVSSQDVGINVATIDPSTGKHSGPLGRLEGRYLAGQTQAQWSPDGRQIAYVQTEQFGVVEGRGAAVNATKRLAVQTIETGDVRFYVLPMTNMQNPAWMPDGKSIVLQGQAAAGQGLYTVNLNSGSITPLANRLATEPPGTPGRLSPAMSADGRSMYFRRNRQEPRLSALAVRDLATGAEREIAADIMTFAVAPDGRWIAVKPLAKFDGQLLILPVGGGEARNLQVGTQLPQVSHLAWSGDSRTVFFVKVADSRQELWQVSIDGGPPQDTGIKLPGAVHRLSMHPDGRRLAISTVVSSTATWMLPGVAK
jgi:Tol biopolymer transport system component